MKGKDKICKIAVKAKKINIELDFITVRKQEKIQLSQPSTS